MDRYSYSWTEGQSSYRYEQPGVHQNYLDYSYSTSQSHDYYTQQGVRQLYNSAANRVPPPLPPSQPPLAPPLPRSAPYQGAYHSYKKFPIPMDNSNNVVVHKKPAVEYQTSVKQSGMYG